MFVVGVTGGIGSGKTAVTDHLETFGITVVDADKAARVVVEPGKPALDEIVAAHSVQRSFSMMARLTGQHYARLSSMTAHSAKFLKASPTRGLGKK